MLRPDPLINFVEKNSEPDSEVKSSRSRTGYMSFRIKPVKTVLIIALLTLFPYLSFAGSADSLKFLAGFNLGATMPGKVHGHNSFVNTDAERGIFCGIKTPMVEFYLAYDVSYFLMRYDTYGNTTNFFNFCLNFTPYNIGIFTPYAGIFAGKMFYMENKEDEHGFPKYHYSESAMNAGINLGTNIDTWKKVKVFVQTNAMLLHTGYWPELLFNIQAGLKFVL